MSLVRAERRRFAKRRMTRWMVAIGVVILALIATALFFTHEVHDAAALARGEVRAQQEYQHALAGYQQYVAGCEKQPGACPELKEGMPGPARSDFRAEDFLMAEFDFKDSAQATLIVWAAIIAMIGFLLGATFVGAEWNSGAMMNLLTWRPNRIAVLGAKLGVALGWMTVIGIGTLALWTGALWLIAELRGHHDGLTSGVVQSMGLSGLRGLAMILLFTALGFGLASIGRHTALALGAALAVIVVGQIGLSIVLSMARVPFLEQYLIPTHLWAWLYKEIELEDYSAMPVCAFDGECDVPRMTITWQDSGSIALGVAAVVLGIAFWQMRRRDAV